MSEKIPNQFEDKESRKLEKIALARELHESNEQFPFPGIHNDVYEKIKMEETEYPGFATPIDELVARCTQEGIKVVLGKNPESGNVFILPAGSDDIENDSLFPRQLLLDAVTSEALQKLIELDTK